MTTPYIDPKVIFASDAPAQDKPPAFANYERGMDATRSNEGRPTIKQENFIQQRNDLKNLYIHENGAALPFNADMTYEENAIVVKDGELVKKIGNEWKKVGDKGYTLDYFKNGESYPLNAEIMLDNGEKVKSTIPNNTNDPNVNMTDWVKTNAASQIFDASGKSQQEINDKIFKEAVSVADFGAKGDGDQTLYATDYYSDQDKSVRITQQTANGLAFNRAIKWLRGKGGGSLYIPPCESGKYYAVYGYLEVIDFPCVIYGAGANSLIKNCDNSPTNTNGYGMFCVQPQNYEEISFLNFKVDGNAEVRIKPTAEFRQYPLAIYGKPQLKMFGITSVNSPIDCFMTGYVDNDPNTYVKTVNCHFDNSFRNTVSLVSGWNQYHVNMTVDRGGYVHGGTQPRYGMDIEPNLVGRSIENLHFTSCQFKRAINVCVGGVWAQAQFDNCTFDGSLAHTSKLTDKTYPWLFQLTEGKWQLNNCRFIGRDDYMQNASHHFNSYNANSKFNDSQHLKLHDCIWEKCGFISTSRSVEMIDCFAQNSLHPFVFSGGTTTNNNDVFIRDLTLKNVFDDGNYGTGTESSFAITNSLGGKIDVDGITVEIDATSLKSIPKELFTRTRYYGVSINPSKSVAAGKRVLVKNVHSEGFYKRLPTYLDRVVNASNMRDWFSPSLPPENTIKIDSTVAATLVDGTVANNQVTNKSVTGVATENNSTSSRTLGNKGAVYQNCTMWGDYS